MSLINDTGYGPGQWITQQIIQGLDFHFDFVASKKKPTGYNIVFFFILIDCLFIIFFRWCAVFVGSGFVLILVGFVCSVAGHFYKDNKTLLASAMYTLSGKCTLPIQCTSTIYTHDASRIQIELVTIYLVLFDVSSIPCYSILHYTLS